MSNATLSFYGRQYDGHEEHDQDHRRACLPKQVVGNNGRNKASLPRTDVKHERSRRKTQQYGKGEGGGKQQRSPMR